MTGPHELGVSSFLKRTGMARSGPKRVSDEDISTVGWGKPPCDMMDAIQVNELGLM